MNTLSDAEPMIQLKQINYRYFDAIPALVDIDLAVGEGAMFAIIGSNGSGKSTLLQILCGLIFPDSGLYRFQGRPVTEKALRDNDFLRFFREKVGIVFQNADVQLFCPTVLDELVFGPLQIGISREESLSRAQSVLAMLEIEYLSDRPPFMLSGGEKKRVAIGSVLTMNPDVLILDEPLSGLDPRSQSFLIELVYSLNQAGKTIILSTHSLQLIDDLQPEVAVLSEAHRVEAVGRAEDILRDQELLVRVNLVHEHLHRHGDKLHRHVHAHHFFHQHK